jgi:hypothetical protein
MYYIKIYHDKHRRKRKKEKNALEVAGVEPTQVRLPYINVARYATSAWHSLAMAMRARDDAHTDLQRRATQPLPTSSVGGGSTCTHNIRACYRFDDT